MTETAGFVLHSERSVVIRKDGPFQMFVYFPFAPTQSLVPELRNTTTGKAFICKVLAMPIWLIKTYW